MSNNLSHLEPRALWTIFGEICAIPHPSKKEARIVEYIKTFGEKLGLETIVDEVGNVLIRKPAASGYENRQAVVLQAHVDMVPQKNNDTVHDFEKDPIDAYVDGDWVTANGTTLGADNGIGVAAAMAILKDPGLKHGPLECLFTIDEETGLTGAFAFKPGVLKGDILLNLDSEDEGQLYIGCAGGVDTIATFNNKLQDVPDNYEAFEIVVKGLKGGHSGMDIHLGRGNANKILNRILWQANREIGLELSHIDGGTLRNAIPREASALVCLPAKNAQAFKEMAATLKELIAKELGKADPGLIVETKPTTAPAKIIHPDITRKLFHALYACPNGVMSMIKDMPDTVETSNNLAIVKSDENIIQAICLQRSSINSSRDNLGNMIRAAFELAGAEVNQEGEYPGWKPNLDSPILKTMKQVYLNKFGTTPEHKVIHGGLECGLLGGTYPNLDMISFGPTIRNPHSPDEMVHIASVKRFWDFLLETLEKTPEK
jgi:dipeptidase D